MIALVFALVAVILSGREHAKGVVTDELLEISESSQDEEFDSISSETESETSEPILEQPSSDEPQIISSRDNAVGRHDGVHGAPLLDGAQFGEWTPQQVQDALNAGWTAEQLRDYYEGNEE